MIDPFAGAGMGGGGGGLLSMGAPAGAAPMPINPAPQQPVHNRRPSDPFAFADKPPPVPAPPVVAAAPAVDPFSSFGVVTSAPPPPAVPAASLGPTPIAPAAVAQMKQQFECERTRAALPSLSEENH